MTDFVGKVSKRMGPKWRQKSPFDSQQDVVGLDQESRFSLFRFMSCPGHEDGGSSRKGLGAYKQDRETAPKCGGLGGIAIPFDKTFRWRKPLVKGLIPWPGFSCFDQYLPDSLLGFQTDDFGPFQVASQGFGCGCLV